MAPGARMGAGSQLAKPLTDRLGGAWDYYRMDSGIYIWGERSRLQAGVTPILSGAGLADNLRAYPHVFHRSGVIEKIYFWFGTNNAGAGPAFRFGLYTNRDSDRALAPGSRLDDSGSFTTWSAANSGVQGGNAVTMSPNRRVNAGDVIWMAWFVNTSFQTAANQSIQAYDYRDTYGHLLLGWNNPEVIETDDTIYRVPTTGLSGNRRWGIIQAQAYGALPDPFPTSANKFLHDGAIAASDVNASLRERCPVWAFKFNAD